jgi:hypothetical protein
VSSSSTAEILSRIMSDSGTSTLSWCVMLTRSWP